MESWKLDVAVLCVFFVRNETFSKVFESVKKARPRVLLLWQDGPRGEKDLDGIKRCRDIAEDVDWNCEVYRCYHTENMGCDPSTFRAFKWAFSIVEKCIILEDDQVPSQSFYSYCNELLNRYEKDERISHICGYNYIGKAEWCPNDYLFAYAGTGAWASWRRVAEKWDSAYSFLKDEYSMKNLRMHYGRRSDMWIKNAERHSETGKEYWESIIGVCSELDSRYAIIPKRNLVKNIGFTDNSTHNSLSDLRVLPKKSRSIFENEAQEMQFPMKHPQYVIPDGEYEYRLYRWNHPGKCAELAGKIQMAINMIKFGYGKELFGRLTKLWK